MYLVLCLLPLHPSLRDTYIQLAILYTASTPKEIRREKLAPLQHHSWSVSTLPYCHIGQLIVPSALALPGCGKAAVAGTPLEGLAAFDPLAELARRPFCKPKAVTRSRRTTVSLCHQYHPIDWAGERAVMPVQNCLLVVSL